MTWGGMESRPCAVAHELSPASSLIGIRIVFSLGRIGAIRSVGRLWAKKARSLELVHTGYLHPEGPKRNPRARNGAVHADKELGKLLVRHGNDA
jgi:hypothetical protein